MLDETVDNFEGLSGSRPTLIQSQPIQPLDRRLDVLLSPDLLSELRLVNCGNDQGQTH